MATQVKTLLMLPKLTSSDCIFLLALSTVRICTPLFSTAMSLSSLRLKNLISLTGSRLGCPYSALPPSTSPDNYHILIVRAAQRGQVLLIARESQRLDQHLVQLKAVHEGPFFEIPDYDVRLEAHMCFLAAGYLLARGRDRDDRNLVVVAPQERLRAADDVAHDDRRTQGVNQVFVVRMQNQTLVYAA